MEDHERLMAALKVVAPLVVLHGKDEKHHYLYEGAVVQAELYNDDQIKSLTDEGFLGSEKDLVAAQENDEPEQPKAPARRTSK